VFKSAKRYKHVSKIFIILFRIEGSS
jgi:hypothetical protein